MIFESNMIWLPGKRVRNTAQSSHPMLEGRLEIRIEIFKCQSHQNPSKEASRRGQLGSVVEHNGPEPTPDVAYAIHFTQERRDQISAHNVHFV